MEAKLYVGNLSHSTTDDNLRELFMQAGGGVSVAAGTGDRRKIP